MATRAALGVWGLVKPARGAGHLGRGEGRRAVEGDAVGADVGGAGGEVERDEAARVDDGEEGALVGEDGAARGGPAEGSDLAGGTRGVEAVDAARRAGDERAAVARRALEDGAHRALSAALVEGRAGDDGAVGVDLDDGVAGRDEEAAVREREGRGVGVAAGDAEGGGEAERAARGVNPMATPAAVTMAEGAVAEGGVGAARGAMPPRRTRARSRARRGRT